MIRRTPGVATLLLLSFCIAPALGQPQQADPDFDTSVKNPAFTKKHPIVLFDEAHHNFHTANGRYKPFADLISHDGCKIMPNRKPFTEKSLRGHDILIIANALGADQMNSPEAAQPAFTDPECDAVRDWVKAGGSLLLITDHHPMGSAAQCLADRFGVDMSKGITPILKFDENTGLGDHPILRGRDEKERVRKVTTFVGQTLKGPKGSTPFLNMADDAKEKMPPGVGTNSGKKARIISSKGRSQAIALALGKGRVLVMGEAAVLSAQIADGEKFGMNAPGSDNRQFALNIIHWLAGLI